MRLTPTALLCALPICLSAADVSGAWTGAAGSPMYFVLKQEGNRVSGTGGPSAADQFVKFDNGKIEGDRLTFRGGPFSFDLKVEDDRLTGEVKSEGGGTVK